MSIRNLDSLFDAASVAVIGASPRPGRVGSTVWRNLRDGGFRGPLMAVNPKYRELDGVPVAASVAELPQAPELAVVCTPPATVPGVVAELGARGTRAAIVLSAGLDAAQKQAMLDAARPHLLRVLGPNCIGLIAPHIGLNASFAHIGARPGELAFVSQSGALVTAMLDWAHGRGIGFSHFVSLGERADVDFGDMLDWLASDARTRAILLYIESIESPRKFMSAARAAARNKPVIVVKSGRSAHGQRAAASHTGALAGSDLVADAALCRAGVLRVDTLQELFVAAETLARLRGRGSMTRLDGAADDTLAILTNGGGAGVLAADAASRAGVPLAEFGDATLAKLDSVLPASWSRGNPVDIIGDAPVGRYLQAIDALDGAASTLLLIHAPTAIVPSAEIAQAIVERPRSARTQLVGCWLGDAAVAEARRRFHDAGIACYPTPEDAVRALAMQRDYRRNQAQLMEAPPAAPRDTQADAATARALLQQALAAGREMLTEPEAKQVLQCYGIPVAATRVVGPDADEAVAAADSIGYPVVLKILSPDLTHKSDIGGVALDLGSADEVRASARSMLAHVRARRPDARLDGFTVQTMVRRRHGHELIVGASIDPVFGPVILFGQGGTAVELVADRAVALPPLNEPLARALVARTRVARLLGGWRDTPAADLRAVWATLQAVSQLLADQPLVAELDINPLIASPDGAIALDARIRVSAKAPAGAAHFAIRPYPSHLVDVVPWQGRTLTVRPIRPEDEAQHLEFLSRLDPEDVRMRVFYSRRTIERSELARLTQIDYSREMAFVAVATEDDGIERTLGVARAVADPDNIAAEFGIIVRSDLKGSGLGALLMRKLIDTLRAQGTQWIVATVLHENRRMLELARELGFEIGAGAPGTDTREIRLKL